MAAATSNAVLLLLLLAAAAVAAASAMPADQLMGWVPGGSSVVCRGTVAECGGVEDEFALDSEVSRRILATSRYISYGSLKRGTVPCSRRGQSYYNCRPGARANPYTRGCSHITRCRS